MFISTRRYGQAFAVNQGYGVNNCGYSRRSALDALLVIVPVAIHDVRPIHTSRPRIRWPFSIATYMRILILFICAVVMHGAERVPLRTVDIGKLTLELQHTISNNGRTIITYVLPSEFWEASLSRNAALSKEQLAEFYKISHNRVMVFLVDLEVGPLGDMTFQEPQGIAEATTVTSRKGANSSVLAKVADEKAGYMISVMGTSFARSLGKMGEGMAVMMFELPDDPGVRYSPYDASDLVVHYRGHEIRFSAPIDALFVPRELANGRQAHVSWLFDPWRGSPNIRVTRDHVAGIDLRSFTFLAEVLRPDPSHSFHMDLHDDRQVA